MTNRRSETRRLVDRYHNVEILIDGMAPAYVFKLRDISSTGMGVLVKEGSDLLNHIKIGEVLDVKYNPSQRSDSSEYFKTKIRHITIDAADSFRGHATIGLSIIEDTTDIS